MSGIRGGVRDQRVEMGGIRDQRVEMSGFRDHRVEMSGIRGGVRDQRVEMSGFRDQRVEMGGIRGGVRDQRVEMGGIRDQRVEMSGFRDHRVEMSGIRGGVRDQRVEMSGFRDQRVEMGGFRDHRVEMGESPVIKCSVSDCSVCYFHKWCFVKEVCLEALRIASSSVQCSVNTDRSGVSEGVRRLYSDREMWARDRGMKSRSLCPHTHRERLAQTACLVSCRCEVRDPSWRGELALSSRD
ncbi:hypothetical protein F2P79_021514 [Pimephales promelas]|nr:hypothetical protein F2P79_021514 [Pimephales promelas]